MAVISFFLGKIKSLEIIQDNDFYLLHIVQLRWERNLVQLAFFSRNFSSSVSTIFSKKQISINIIEK